MPNKPITITAIDEFIATRQKVLAFPDWLEDRLEQDSRRRRAQRLRAAVPSLVVIYNSFLLLDLLVVPDQLAMAFLLHFAVVTPWILLTGWLTTENSSKLLREGLAASIPVVIVIQILVLYAFTSSENAAHYQYFVLLVVLFTNTVQRLPFRYAVVVSLAILVCHAAVTLICGRMTGPAALMAEITLVVATFLTLVSNYFLERDGRRMFLHTLRDHLIHADVEVAANSDALTGLANRHHLARRLVALWQPDNDAASPVSVIMIDIDHFKQFNDRYGHGAGDDCLKRVASCAIEALRDEQDLAVRYGGEEMLILLTRTDLSAALRMAEAIRGAIENLRIPHEALGVAHVVTVSCGVAAGPVAAVPADELIAAADTALYAAKRSGRNRVWPLRAQDVMRALESKAG